MKHFLSAALAMVLGITALTAQPGPGRGPRPAGTPPEADKTARIEERVNRRVDCMKEQLSLTDKQVNDLTNVYTNYFNKQEKARIKHRESQRKNFEAKEASVAKILTPEQLRKLQEMPGVERRRDASCRGDGPRAAGRRKGHGMKPGERPGQGFGPAPEKGTLPEPLE